MARAMAPPSWAVRLSSLNCSSSVRAPGAATCPGAILTAWGFLGRFMAVSKRDLLTCKHRDKAIVGGIWNSQNFSDPMSVSVKVAADSEATLMLTNIGSDTSSFQLDANTHAHIHKRTPTHPSTRALSILAAQSWHLTVQASRSCLRFDKASGYIKGKIHL